MVTEIEALVKPAPSGQGGVKVTGIIEEEEINSKTGTLRRVSTAKNSVDNVITALSRLTGMNMKDYDIHLNFPGGIPIDGPSAGVALMSALYSALYEVEIPSKIAMTGEVSIKGKVQPVGGVTAKIEAAIEAGIEKVLIPTANYQRLFGRYPINIVCVDSVSQLFQEVFGQPTFSHAAAPSPITGAL